MPMAQVNVINGNNIEEYNQSNGRSRMKINNIVKIMLMLIVFVIINMQMLDLSSEHLTPLQNIFRNIWVHVTIYLIILSIPAVLQVLVHTVTWSWYKTTLEKFLSNMVEMTMVLSIVYLLFQLNAFIRIYNASLAQ